MPIESKFGLVESLWNHVGPSSEKTFYVGVNSSQDQVNVDIEDVMSPSRQDEIESFVELLARYNPTHIAVEFPTSAQAQVDAAYSSYAAGDIELRPIEAHQIGYRLGKLSGHTRVYAVDWNGNPPGDLEDYE